MIRKIIKVDSIKCNGCGLCVKACHEGAIGLENGKAKLLRDDYCDGLGDCLPACPVGAISFEEREAAAYDEEVVKENIAAKQKAPEALACGCPGTHSRTIGKNGSGSLQPQNVQIADGVPSRLQQWPVQLKLVPAMVPYFDEADILVAADCTAYAYGNFHSDFIDGKITLIGCPKLDDTRFYAEKLAEIISCNDIKSLTVVRMEVPCCGGIVEAVKTALKASEKVIPWQVVTISTDGEILGN